MQLKNGQRNERTRDRRIVDWVITLHEEELTSLIEACTAMYLLTNTFGFYLHGGQASTTSDSRMDR